MTTHAVAVAIPPSVISLVQLDDAKVQRSYNLTWISPGVAGFADIQSLRRLAHDAKWQSQNVSSAWTRGERAAVTRWANTHK